MFTCHLCKHASIKIEDWSEHRFDTFEELREHRRDRHPLLYADGLLFEHAEVKLTRSEYYWIARQTRDTRWLKQWLE